MNITTIEHQNPSVTVLQLEGRFHLGNAALLKEKAQQAHDSGAKNLILDLSGVQSLTSEGLRNIHFAHNLFADPAVSTGDGKTKSPHVKLAGPSPDIQRILKIAGYDLFLEIFDTPEQALASF